MLLLKKISFFSFILLLLFTGCKDEEKVEKKKIVDINQNLIKAVGQKGFYQTEIKKEAITIGLNLPLTGPYQDQGKDELRAFQLAIKEINQRGGILGKQINYVVMDTKSKPKIAVENVKRLINEFKAIMISGGVSSGVAVAVSEECQKQKVIFMATVTHSNATTGIKAHRHMFRKCTSATMDARALAFVLSKYHGKGTSYFFITADYTWGWTTEKSMKVVLEKAKANVVETVRVPLGTKDYMNILTKIQNYKVDMLVLILFGNDLVNAIKQVTKLGLKKEGLKIIVPYIELNMAIRAGKEAISGIITSAPWYWKLEKIYKNAKIFVGNFESVYNRKPSNCAESAYMCIIEYIKAVERAKSFDSKLVIKKLEGHEFIGLKGKEKWREWDHQCVQTVYLLQGKLVERMRDEYDFFDIIFEVEGGKIVRSREENPIKLEPLE